MSRVELTYARNCGSSMSVADCSPIPPMVGGSVALFQLASSRATHPLFGNASRSELSTAVSPIAEAKHGAARKSYVMRGCPSEQRSNAWPSCLLRSASRVVIVFKVFAFRLRHWLGASADKGAPSTSPWCISITLQSERSSRIFVIKIVVSNHLALIIVVVKVQLTKRQLWLI